MHDHSHVFPKTVGRFTENRGGRISLSVVKTVAFRAAVFFSSFFFSTKAEALARRRLV